MSHIPSRHQIILMNFYNSFYDILHLFNLQDPSGVLEELSGGIAQLGERLPCKQEVAGSIPAVSTKQDKDPAPEENKVRL